jgi:hypothetical protein
MPEFPELIRMVMYLMALIQDHGGVLRITGYKRVHASFTHSQNGHDLHAAEGVFEEEQGLVHASTNGKQLLLGFQSGLCIVMGLGTSCYPVHLRADFLDPQDARAGVAPFNDFGLLSGYFTCADGRQGPPSVPAPGPVCVATRPTPPRPPRPVPDCRRAPHAAAASPSAASAATATSCAPTSPARTPRAGSRRWTSWMWMP